VIAVGDRAPELAGEGTDGRAIRLSALCASGKWVVVYFFGKAFSAG